MIDHNDIIIVSWRDLPRLFKPLLWLWLVLVFAAFLAGVLR